MAGKKMCTDHLGNNFKSLSEMCRHWGISVATYLRRTRSGMSVKDTLETSTRKVYRGLNGEEYSSMTKLAVAYNINPTTLHDRLNSGWKLEDALVNRDYSAKSVKDHLNNQFKSIRDMCSYWGVSYSLYSERVKLGWGIREALTTPATDTTKECMDHLGNKYDSVSSMCKAYGISIKTYQSRIRYGWSVERALTTPTPNKEIVRDHLGNKYESIASMCRQYGIKDVTYQQRLDRGWSIEDALTKEIDTKFVDHLGNKFKTQKEMCKHHGVPFHRFAYRLSQGATLEEALSPEKHTGAIMIEDNLGNKFNSINDICKHYGATDSTLTRRIKNLVEIEIALTVKGSVTLAFIGLDGKARYQLGGNSGEFYTSRQIIEKYRPDLLAAYDKHNPTGKYNPYKPHREGTIHE